MDDYLEELLDRNDAIAEMYDLLDDLTDNNMTLDLF